MGSSVAVMKSSTEPSFKKQFIWLRGTPRACQLKILDVSCRFAWFRFSAEHSRVTQESLDHDLVKEHRPEPLVPDPFLLGNGGRVTHSLHIASHARQVERDLRESKSPARVSSEVEVAVELVGMSLPVRISVATCQWCFPDIRVIDSRRQEWGHLGGQ